MKRKSSIWVIVPVAIALSFLLGRVPSELGVYSLYSTLATVTVPQPQTFFIPKEEPLPVLATVKKQVGKVGSVRNRNAVNRYQAISFLKTEVLCRRSRNHRINLVGGNRYGGTGHHYSCHVRSAGGTGAAAEDRLVYGELCAV